MYFSVFLVFVCHAFFVPSQPDQCISVDLFLSFFVLFLCHFYLLRVENFLLLGQCLHPHLDVVEHVNGADARLVLPHALLVDLQNHLFYLDETCYIMIYNLQHHLLQVVEHLILPSSP